MTGLVTVHVHLPTQAHAADLSPLRTALIADVLARTVELRGGAAYSRLVPPPGFTADRLPALRAELAELWIGPPELDGGDLPGSAVHVFGPDGAATPASGRRYDVASADGEGSRIRDDPLALRLALLSVPSGQQVTVTTGTVAEAAGTLTRWRDAVAAWAERPSAPPRGETVAAVRAALSRGPDTRAVLAELRQAETADLPEGAKFELFVYADRVLGVDLAGHLGRRT